MSRLTLQPVDLDRTFVQVRPDQPISSAIDESGWFRNRDTLTWPALLARPRVIVLAEANSGKTFEFKRQVHHLLAANTAAFFAPIEQLATSDLKRVLGLEWRAFESWQASGQPGWFFLDSVDEAKLTHRNFELALNQFALELGSGFQRAHIIISCRGTDWRGDADLKWISEALPATPVASAELEGEDALLARLNTKAGASSPAEAAAAYTTVAMTGLTVDQRRRFLAGVSMPDVEGFEAALAQKGLLPFAERPGDLLVLASYWAEKRALGTLTQMMEVSLTARIVQRRDRPGLNLISDDKARHGAERIAAAMVMGQAMTLRVDPAAEGEGVSLAAILTDWTPAEQTALMDRGVFAVATYGQRRFNHRSEMEYLASQWFRRILGLGCPTSRIMAIMTAKPFGVDTLPPALRATAAWLAPHCEPLRRFILAHAPLTLIQHGDPAALAIPDRAALLNRYAELHQAGRLRLEYADAHALWMFADPKLAPTLKAIWPDADDDVRFEVLRLIEQGGITACSNLAADAVLDETAGTYTRVVAAQLLARFRRKAPLLTLTARMLKTPQAYSAKLGPQLAAAIFPLAMTVGELLALIEHAPAARRYEHEGFGTVLAPLYTACPTTPAKHRFIDGVVALCLKAPLDPNEEPISRRYGPLARQVSALITVSVKDIEAVGVWPGLAALVWIGQATEDRTAAVHDQITAGVRAHTALNAALFWYGVDRVVRQMPDVDPLRLWRWQSLNRAYWSITAVDRSWLMAAAEGRDIVHRRVAFSALLDLADGDDDPLAARGALVDRFGDDPTLAADLDARLNPPPPDAEWQAHETRRIARQDAEAFNKRRVDEDWKQFRARMVAAPTQLEDEAGFKQWPGFQDLVTLTRWLAKGSQGDFSQASLHYADLGPAFSPEVATAYRRALLRFWRVMRPSRPKILPDGRWRTPYSIHLAMAGLALDAASTPYWARSLSIEEAQRAVAHAFASGLGLPDWLDGLLVAYPAVVEPEINRALKREWAMALEGFTPMLYRAGTTLPITPGIERTVLKLIDGEAEQPSARLEDTRKLLSRMPLTSAKARALTRRSQDRFKAAAASDDWDQAVGLVAILFRLDPLVATASLQRLLDAQIGDTLKERTEGAIGTLFGMHRGRVSGLLNFPEDVLADLLRLIYRYVRPEEDHLHDGAYSPDTRDDAETARNELLGALMQKRGERPFLVMRQLLAEGAFGPSTRRLQRLAEQMAEAASDGGPWSEAAVIEFEKENIEPVTTGERLFALVCEMVDDIAQTLQASDVSAREVLLTATSEHAVQSWLAHELRGLARGRFTVPIEAEAIGRDRLDIVVSANAAAVEVAVEMKHGGMGWSYAEYRRSLKHQLGQRYLKPPQRRHGLLVVSNHGDRRWSDGAGGVLRFDELIGRLASEAATLTKNRYGPIHLAVRGLDADLATEAVGSKRSPARTRLR